MDQRARLVEVDEVERDAELDGSERDAALQHLARRIEGGDRSAAGAVGARPFELDDERLDDVVGDDLAVRRDVARAGRAGARARPVEVGAADVERILAEPARDRVDRMSGSSRG